MVTPYYLMIIRKRHKFEIASLRDAGTGMIYRPQTALRLSGVIEIKPLRGFFVHSTGVCTRLRGVFAHSTGVRTRLRSFFVENIVTP